MKKKLLSLLALLTLSSVLAIAQTKISGVVISQEDGEPIIGASVKLAGSKTGAITDIDGKFSLTSTSANPVITVSYIGMLPKTLKGTQNMRIELEPDATTLEEVVVTGMQKVDKRLFTGATTKLSGADSKIDGLADASRSLEGRAAGVSVQNVTGTFGTAPKIRVRGAEGLL